jgi:hypothetical protein
MTRPMIYAAAVFVLLAAATTALRSHTYPAELAGAASADMMPLQELHAAAAHAKLPAEDFEDMSLIYPTRQSK